MRFASSRSTRPRLRELVAALDEDDAPAAATWRLVGETAATAGLPRPSYPHVRRLVEPDGRRMLPDRLAAAGVHGPAVAALQRAGSLLVDGRTVTLAATGVSVDGPRDLPWGRSAYVRDPDGRLVELA